MSTIDYPLFRNAIQIILEQMQANGISPPPGETVPNSVVLTFPADEEVEEDGH